MPVADRRGAGAATTAFKTFAFAGLLVMMCCLRVVAAQSAGEGCDWSGSGLDYNERERGVQPIYMRCAQGRVEWKYPRGALRVVLRLGTSGKDFRGCLKAGRRMRGAHVYLEGHRALHPLYSPGDERHPQLPRCFASRHGQVALYVEAEPSSAASALSSLKRHVVEFSYDLRLKTHSKYAEADPLEECKPCSEAELLRHFCSADFLAQGTISGLYRNEALSRAELTVRADRVVRQTTPVFHPRQPEAEADFRYGTVHLPLACGAKHGGGRFLFVGRIMLDEPVLQCAPRLEEWEAIKVAARRDGTNQCELD